jgi:hypothetical protein
VAMPGAQIGASQRSFPIISGLDIATFHSESACGSREASDKRGGDANKTRLREIGKWENLDWRPPFSELRNTHSQNFGHGGGFTSTTQYDNSTNVGDLRKRSP